jgi:hypothetical protein
VQRRARSHVPGRSRTFAVLLRYRGAVPWGVFLSRLRSPPAPDLGGFTCERKWGCQPSFGGDGRGPQRERPKRLHQNSGAWALGISRFKLGGLPARRVPPTPSRPVASVTQRALARPRLFPQAYGALCLRMSRTLHAGLHARKLAHGKASPAQPGALPADRRLPTLAGPYRIEAPMPTSSATARASSHSSSRTGTPLARLICSSRAARSPGMRTSAKPSAGRDERSA